MNDILLGAKHIMDLNGFDHMLFLITLASAFDLSKVWRIVLLATAFTVGHSLTLILADTDIVRSNIALIEFFIPLSIMIMAIAATLGVSMANKNSKYSKLVYGVTVFFGLIHGLGFSSFFRINAGDGEGMLFKLLKFNLGVEVGQILILLFALSIFSLARVFGVTPRTQQIFIGGLALGLSTLMTLENWPL